MKRNEIIRGLHNIDLILEEANALATIRSLIAISRKATAGDQEERKNALQGMRVFVREKPNLDANTFQLITSLELDDLFSDDFWDEALTGGLISSELSQLYTHARAARAFIPNFIEVIESESIRSIEAESEVAGSKFYGKALLRVIVIEEGEEFSKPGRISTVLTSINELYEASAIILNIRNQPLSVVACDSGSDKSFDLLGAAQVIESVRQILLDVWENVIFFRERKQERALALVAQSLPILEQIKQMESDKQLEREMAKLLELNITRSTMAFVSAGAMIPEMEDKKPLEPRQLMAPEKKYLSPPPETAQEDEDTTSHVKPYVEFDDFNFDITDDESDEDGSLDDESTEA